MIRPNYNNTWCHKSHFKLSNCPEHLAKMLVKIYKCSTCWLISMVQVTDASVSDRITRGLAPARHFFLTLAKGWNRVQVNHSVTSIRSFKWIASSFVPFIQQLGFWIRSRRMSDYQLQRTTPQTNPLLTWSFRVCLSAGSEKSSFSWLVKSEQWQF